MIANAFPMLKYLCKQAFLSQETNIFSGKSAMIYLYSDMVSLNSTTVYCSGLMINLLYSSLENGME